MVVSLRHSFTSPKADDANAAADNRVLPSNWNANHALTAAANTVLARSGTTPGAVTDVALAASQLLGRGVSSDVSAITIGAGLSMTGNVLVATGTAPDLSGYATLAGATFTGNISAPFISSGGASAGFQFQRRDGASNGVLYSTGGAISIYTSVGAVNLFNLAEDRTAQTILDPGGTNRQIYHAGNINNWRPATTTRFSGFTIVAADAYGLHQCSGTFNVPLTAAGTLGDGFECLIQNTGGGAITLTPASGTIGGLAALVITPGSDIIRIRVAGGNWVYSGQLYGEVTLPSTSGTAVDFTSIPAWANWIEVLHEGVSTNGTSNHILQVGSGSFAVTGYNGCLGSIQPGTTSGASVNYSSSFVLTQAIPAATDAFSGLIRLAKRAGNFWYIGGNYSTSNGTANRIGVIAGHISLGGVLDRIRCSSVTPDTFDAGNITVRYGN
jgi:hypothetical protein